MFSPKAACSFYLHFSLLHPQWPSPRHLGVLRPGGSDVFPLVGVLGPRENQTSLLRGAGIFNPIGNYH